MSIRTYSLKCLSCRHSWIATVKELKCPFCGSEAVADVGLGKG